MFWKDRIHDLVGVEVDWKDLKLKIGSVSLDILNGRWSDNVHLRLLEM